MKNKIFCKIKITKISLLNTKNFGAFANLMKIIKTKNVYFIL